MEELNEKERKEIEDVKSSNKRKVLEILILILLILICLLLLRGCKGKKGGPGNDLEISDNIVSITDIPVEEILEQSKMAYISGQSLTTINEKNPYVYLQNEEVNTDYYLQYEVYLQEDMVYKTDLIPAGTAVPWDAYSNEKIKSGENEIWYTVKIYNLEKELMANTTLDGLKIIKK